MSFPKWDQNEDKTQNWDTNVHVQTLKESSTVARICTSSTVLDSKPLKLCSGWSRSKIYFIGVNSKAGVFFFLCVHPKEPRYIKSNWNWIASLVCSSYIICFVNYMSCVLLYTVRYPSPLMDPCFNTANQILHKAVLLYHRQSRWSHWANRQSATQHKSHRLWTTTTLASC